MSAFTDTMRAMVGSKKWQAAMIGVIVAGLSKLGLAVDTETVALILSPLLAYIVGQGIADHGKPAAELKSATSSDIAAIGGQMDWAIDQIQDLRTWRQSQEGSPHGGG